MAVPTQIGRYRVVRELFQSGMDVVYLGHDGVLGRNVLIKCSSKAPADDKGRESLSHIYEREAKHLATLTHPNIVTIADLGEEEGRPYIVMVPEAEGTWHRVTSLECAIRDGISIGAAFRTMVDVLNGLAHIDEHGILHGGITPAHVLERRPFPAQIMDFSLARPLPRTRTGIRPPGTLSPEAIRGKKMDGRHDLFAVGSILYGLLAGHPPFHPDNITEMLYRIVIEEPDMTAIPTGSSWEGIRSVITCALQKNPQDRYPDAAAMSKDLVLALEGLGKEAERMVNCRHPEDLPTGPLVLPVPKLPPLPGESG